MLRNLRNIPRLKMNPFLITGYISPEYFCDRENETKRLTNSILNRRNVILFSRRRIGKTALINHVFHKLGKNKTTKAFYVDLYSTNDIKEFTESLAKAVIGELDSGLKKLTDNLRKIFGNLRPTISYDPLTGNPVLSFDWLNSEQANTTLEGIFSYLDESKKNIVIAFDEFQQVTNYPQKNIEALLRTHLQNSPNITLIFSGSQDHLITSMFKDKSRPFYQSGELFHLEKISEQSYKKFIMSAFKKGSKKIEPEVVDFVLNICEVHTYYVQYLCNRLYSLDVQVINEQVVSDTLLQILNENETYYLNYRNLLTRNQWTLLTAIAKENGIQQITSQKFINKYSLNTPSSVKAALDVLIQKGTIYYSNNIYEVDDIFLKMWLQRN